VSWRSVSAVARWEFRRYAKPRDLLIGTLVFALLFGIFGFVEHLVERKRNEPRDIAVRGAERMGLQEVESLQRFRIHSSDDDSAVLERALADKEFDAILVVESADVAELRVRSESPWQEEFLALVATHRQARRPHEFGLEPNVLAELTAPMTLTRVEVDGSGEASSRAKPLTVLIVVGTMLLGLFLGFSYVFVAITGEKTQRVTESVLAAITPQQWIDGKILGLTLVVLVNVLCYGIGYLLYKAVARLVLDAPFRLPPGIDDPIVLTWLVVFSLLGFGFWFTLFAVVAATISDPNTSSRSALLFLPFLPLGFTLTGLDQPDSVGMRVLALLPGISPAAMPVRLLRGEPALVEILVSIALLVAAVWLFRRAAGRVFGLSMLMTGKEPRWSEVWRWLRET
jgi:ABC-2 type transport system permease protein